jgi:hypothetical protein
VWQRVANRMIRTEFLLPLHESEPLLATQLEGVAQEREASWSRWEFSPWTLQITRSQEKSKANCSPEC